MRIWERGRQLLEVDSLTVRHGPIEAVREVSLRAEAGQLVTLIGPNGAGKTSLLMAIAGVYRASGAIALKGEPILGLRPEQIVARGVCLVPEGRRILGTLTVAENLLLAATGRRRRKEAGAVVEEMYERFPSLSRLRRSFAGKLSGGEQQQLAIARALTSNPQVLMLDEPSLGLAPMVVDQVFEIVGELRDAGTTVILVEQQALRAVAIADHAYVLRGGRIEVQGSSEELSDSDTLAAAYLGETA